MITLKNIAVFVSLVFLLSWTTGSVRAAGLEAAALSPDVLKKIQNLSCDPFKNILRKGDTDATTDGEITRLQTLLMLDPQNAHDLTINGFFDNATEKAVMNIQKKIDAGITVRDMKTQQVLQPDAPGVIGPYTSTLASMLCAVGKAVMGAEMAHPAENADAAPAPQPLLSQTPISKIFADMMQPVQATKPDLQTPVPVAEPSLSLPAEAQDISLPAAAPGETASVPGQKVASIAGKADKVFRIPGQFSLMPNQRAIATIDGMQVTMARADQGCGTIEVEDEDGATPAKSTSLTEDAIMVDTPHQDLKIACALGDGSPAAGYVVFDLPK